MPRKLIGSLAFVTVVAIAAGGAQAQDAGFRALKDVDRAARNAGPPPVASTPPPAVVESDQKPKKQVKKKQSADK